MPLPMHVCTVSFAEAFWKELSVAKKTPSYLMSFGGEVMSREQHGAIVVREGSNFVESLRSELSGANGEYSVDDEIPKPTCMAPGNTADASGTMTGGK